MLLRLLSGPGPQRREKHSPAWTASPRTRVPRSDGAFRGCASEKPPALAVGSRHKKKTDSRTMLEVKYGTRKEPNIVQADYGTSRRLARGRTRNTRCCKDCSCFWRINSVSPCRAAPSRVRHVSRRSHHCIKADSF